MSRAVFTCAEEAGGCGVMWTPISGNRRPIKDEPAWAWCPDCIRAGVPEEVAAHVREAGG